MCVLVCKGSIQTLTAAKKHHANDDHNAEALSTQGTAVLHGIFSLSTMRRAVRTSRKSESDPSEVECKINSV